MSFPSMKKTLLSCFPLLILYYPNIPADAVITTVTTGSFPIAIAPDSVTDKIYVVNENPYGSMGTVTVIDGVTYSTMTVNVGSNSCAIAVNPATNKIYVANEGSGTVSLSTERPVR